MGCNCKVNQQIMKIHKQYGKKINIPWKENVKFKVVEGFKFILLGIIALALSPILFIIILIFVIKGYRTFNVNKILKYFLGKN